MTSKKTGRKPKDKADKLQVRSTRFTADELAVLQAVAGINSTSVTQFIRQASIEKAKETLLSKMIEADSSS